VELVYQLAFFMRTLPEWWSIKEVFAQTYITKIFVLYFLLEIFTCRSIYDAFDIIFYMKQVYIIIFSLCISIVLQNNLLRRLDHSLDYFYDSSKRRLFTYI
jgi:hypothetical protein